MENVNEYDKRNGNVVFKEDVHKYWDLTNPTAEFISVTTLIERFGQKFDKEFWSMYKSLEKLIPKEDWKTISKTFRDKMKIPEDVYTMYDFTKQDAIKGQQDILDEWQKNNEESCTRGTAIHAELENSFYKMGANCTLKKFGIGGKFVCDKGRTTLDLEDGVYPEYLISRVSDDGILRLAGQIDLLVKKGHHYIIIDHKGLPLDTEIPTQNGYKSMKDLKVGDKVFDENGDLCTVTVKSEIHHNPCYKINFTKDFSIVADKDHRWEITFTTHPNTKYHGNPIQKIMTTEELYNYCLSYNKNNQYKIPRIYVAKALNCEEKKFIIDPYVLGLWLGDGDSTCGKITQELNSKSWDIIKSKGYTISNNMENREGVKAETRNVYGLMTNLRKLHVLNNKHIPKEYLRGSFNQRLELLQGLMDADGFYDKVHDTFIMSTDYQWQYEDMVRLVSSLGLKCTVNYVKRPGYIKNRMAWDIKFKSPEYSPFKCRNINIVTKDTPISHYFKIKSIDKTDMVPTQCIAVDSPTHTYLCTKYNLVTHNTNKEIKKSGYYNSKNKCQQMMKYPLNKLPDCNYSHYNLQLSTYAWMIQKLDPEAVIDDLILNWYPHEGGNEQFHMEYLKKDVIKMLSYYKMKKIQELNELKYKEIDY